MGLCGGIGDAKPADPEVQQLIEKVKDQVVEKANQALDEFEAVSYATQVVAGTNFFVKVKIGDGKYIHLRIFRPLPPNHEQPELSSLEENKTEADPLR